jgi:carnitine O-acetyltransferase
VSGSQNLSPRTFGNEKDLPQVPLPSLDDSCDRFLEWCAPLLTEKEIAETKDAVAEFQRPDGPGPVLHAALEEYDRSGGVHSWLDTFWPYRYLGRRDRIALNANFIFLFRESGEDQVERASALVASAVDYKRRVDEETLPPAVQKGRPLSMAQHKYLFSTTRIPGLVQDSVRSPYSEEWPGPSPARHILVFFRGSMFRMDVVDPDGRPYPPDDIAAGLRTVMKAEHAPEPHVGSLTTMARAEWASARESLQACDPANEAALDEVEAALFCLCLEDFAPADTLAACDALLYGDGGNRWFDKAVSLVVFADGTAGINVEHCELDGTTILAFVDTLLTLPATTTGSRPEATPPVRSLTFVLDDDLRATASDAAAAFAEYGAATATTTVSFDDFGSDDAKRLGVSPDAFVQMAYQLAHKRAKGFTGATYESIATRQYRNGRTEAMRVVTPAVLPFVAAMDDPSADTEARRAAFQAAANAHVTRAKECQSGQAPEQHLWELQLIQKRRGASLGVIETPSLYASPGWLKMRDDYLSTSSAPSANIQYFGFGSTSPHCIGVAYVLLSDRFNIYLSTPQAVADEMYRFADELRTAIGELRSLLR